MRIYFTIMYYDQWRPPIKGFTPCRTVALFVEDNDFVASSSFSHPTPHGDNNNRRPPPARANDDDDVAEEEDMLY